MKCLFCNRYCYCEISQYTKYLTYEKFECFHCRADFWKNKNFGNNDLYSYNLYFSDNNIFYKLSISIRDNTTSLYEFCRVNDPIMIFKINNICKQITPQNIKQKIKTLIIIS